MLGAPTGTLISNFLSYLSSTSTTYVALHSGSPSMYNSGANELGNRQRVYWTVNNNLAYNTNDLVFVGLTTSSISYITINDALTGGNVLFMIPLLEPYTLTVTGSTGVYVLNSNSIFLNFETNPSVYAIDGGTPYTVWSTPTVAIGDGGTP